MAAEYTDNSREVLSRIDKAIELALEEIAREFEHHARQDYVPVDTGRLKNSIRHKNGKRETTIFTDVEYAPYQEFGTRPNGRKGVPATHFFKKSGENHQGEYQAILQKHLNDA